MEEDNNQSFNIFTDISNCLKELKTPRVTFEPLYKPVVNDLPIIYVYPPTVGSSRWFDVASFFFVNIVKERDLKYEIRYTVDSEASPDGKLPYIMLQDTTCLTTEAALARLVEECDKLSDSTGEEKSPSVEAFIHLIKTTLTPAIQLCIWSQKEFVREIVQTFSAHNGCTKVINTIITSKLINEASKEALQYLADAKKIQGFGGQQFKLNHCYYYYCSEDLLPEYKKIATDTINILNTSISKSSNEKPQSILKVLLDTNVSMFNQMFN